MKKEVTKTYEAQQADQAIGFYSDSNSNLEVIKTKIEASRWWANNKERYSLELNKTGLYIVSDIESGEYLIRFH